LIHNGLLDYHLWSASAANGANLPVDKTIEPLRDLHILSLICCMVLRIVPSDLSWHPD